MTRKADPGMTVGHVHLKVSDLDRSVQWYGRVLGFDLMQKFGDSAAFMSAGGYHHHLGLNTWHSEGGPPPHPRATGLYHVAFLYPSRAALGAALKQVLEEGVQLSGAADHGVSEAIYFDDPDGNGIELYRDRDPKDWPKDDTGNLAMVNARLDLDALLAEAD